ncbi:MAG: DUF177 domain-containing protein [Rubrivivax sp.]|nr:DUF177 domain-containing protein [Rubrivivax sp.]
MARPPRQRHRPQALDVAAFCEAGERLEGEVPLRELPRLAEAVRCGDDGFAGAAAVRWQASGETVQRRAGAAQWVIALAVDASVMLECQRCLQPVVVPLSVRRRVHFVAGEDEAARLDEEIDDDVLALPARLDLRLLVEDELLLALPLVPQHAQCPRLHPALQPTPGTGPVATPADATSPERPTGGDPDRSRPFAVLTRLAKPAAPESGEDPQGGGG